jgi:hypothetical protein
VPQGPYLGQANPGLTAQIFAPGIISIAGSEFRESTISFWLDGNRCIFTRFGKDIPDFTVFETKIVNGVWVKPIVSDILKEYGGYLPYVSFDGNKIYFIPADSVETYPPKICFVEFVNGQWTQPKYICDGMYPSVTKDGTLYYDYHGHIVRRRYEDGAYLGMERIGKHVLTEFEDAHPYIAPDESYIIFDSSERPGVSNNDLFISFRTGHNSWTEPQNMSNILGIRPSGLARVSYDGKYLFFKSGNDIYWISANIIEKFKPETLKK